MVASVCLYSSVSSSGCHGLESVIVIFPGHTYMLFGIIFMSCDRLNVSTWCVHPANPQIGLHIWSVLVFHLKKRLTRTTHGVLTEHSYYFV